MNRREFSKSSAFAPLVLAFSKKLAQAIPLLRQAGRRILPVDGKLKRKFRFRTFRVRAWACNAQILALG
jgi:hypothetical protein